MSIIVVQNISEKTFPVTININGKFSYLTLKAAIDLRIKLDSAISDYQIEEAKSEH
jgi:hypothetical protein